MKSKLFRTMVRQNISLILLVVISSVLAFSLGLWLFLTGVYQGGANKDLKMNDQRYQAIYIREDGVDIGFDLGPGQWLEVLEGNQVSHILGHKLDNQMTYTSGQLSYLANDLDRTYNRDGILYDYIVVEDHKGQLRTVLLKTKMDGVRLSSNLGLALNLDPESQDRVANKLVLVVLAYLVVIACLVSYFARRSSQLVVQPLGQLRTSLKGVREGDYGGKLTYESKNELALIQADYNYTLDQLGALQAKEAKGKASKKQFILDISHDLKTPLTSLLGYTKALVDTRCEGDLEIYNLLYGKTKQIKDLVDTLTDYTRLDAEDMILTLKTVNLVAYLKAQVSDYYDEIEKRNSTLVMDIDQDPLMVDIDPILFRRVIGNILMNALDHNQGPISLGLDLERTGDQVRISLWDTGVGILEKNLDLIFDQATQVETSRPSGSGHGFGLSIARNIVEKHGGFIWAESQPHKRTTFIIKLPLKKPIP